MNWRGSESKGKHVTSLLRTGTGGGSLARRSVAREASITIFVDSTPRSQCGRREVDLGSFTEEFGFDSGHPRSYTSGPRRTP